MSESSKQILEKLESQAGTECANFEEHKREHDRYVNYAAQHRQEMNYWKNQYELTQELIKMVKEAEE